MNKTELIDKLLHLGSTIEICNSSKTSKKAKELANTLLDNYLESINYTHSCTELKTLKQGEKLILDNKFDVEVVAPSEKNVLIKYKETDRVVWVNEQRLKQKQFLITYNLNR